MHTVIKIRSDEVVNDFPDDLANLKSQLFVYSRCGDLAECWERVLLIRFVFTVGFACDDLAMVSTITPKQIGLCRDGGREIWLFPAIPAKARHILRD
jgi:hypothetical protein